MERDLGVRVDGKLNMSQQVCPGSQKGQPYPGVHQAQHSQPIKGGDCPTLHCTGVAPLRVLCAVLGASIQEGHHTIRVCPEEGDQDGERPQGQDLKGAAEVTCFVQLGEEDD